MKYSTEISTSHSIDALLTLLSDPSFVLPKIFKSIKKIETTNSRFSATASYLGLTHEVNGNVFRSVNEISYVFILRHGKDTGSGKLSFIISNNKVDIIFEYEGWMERLSQSIIIKWIKEFCSNFEEDIRIERIKRKL
ncbi:DUF3211 domain-containing protein [Acidianus infernus]|uniref:DUF3211 domain-containing protein n=1 Tax=Acidianus infernus TaxID=12915 RepID=A0A6A9QIS2_ACIIN|nr:DUF3211 domain-containing protein [Acidianus infernus]MUM65066.1 DUF3211 domain-containing protein [Acidianus infernus]